MSHHSHKDELFVGPYRLEKTLGKGQTGKNALTYTMFQFISITMNLYITPSLLSNSKVICILAQKVFLREDKKV